MRYSLAVLHSLLLLLAAACVTTGKPIPNSEAVTCPFPAMQVGDSWTFTGYSGKYDNDVSRQTVVGVDADGSFRVEGRTDKGECYVDSYNARYQLVRKVDLASNTDAEIDEPPALRLDFPLQIGKTWSDKYVGTTYRGGHKTYINRYTVKDYVELTVPAGTFRAFQIYRLHTAQGENWSSYEMFWYAPAAKAVVKTAPSWRPGIEMTAFTPARN